MYLICVENVVVVGNNTFLFSLLSSVDVVAWSLKLFLVTDPRLTSPVPPPPPPPQIIQAVRYHQPTPVAMAMSPVVTTTLPPQHLQSVYPTAISVSYGYTAVPVNGHVSAPLITSQMAALPLNGHVAASPIGAHVAAPQQLPHMTYHSDPRQHALPIATVPVQQMATPPQTVTMQPAAGQPMAQVMQMQHAVHQMAPSSHSPSIQHRSVAVAQQPSMAYPFDPRSLAKPHQYVKTGYPEQSQAAPPMVPAPATAYPMQQHQLPSQQPALLPTPTVAPPQRPQSGPPLQRPPAGPPLQRQPSGVVPPQRPPSGVVPPQRPPSGPPSGPSRGIPSLMSLPSFPTKAFNSKFHFLKPPNRRFILENMFELFALIGNH